MQEHAVTIRLQQLFSSLPETPNATVREELRRNVHEFVDISKVKGAPVERVIVALKEIASAAGMRSTSDMVSLRAELTPRDRLLLDVVRWVVERYFDYQRPSGQGKGGAEPLKRPPRGGHEMAPYRRIVPNFARL